MVEVHERPVELIGEARAARAGAELIVGAEHDVVGEQLGAPVEQLRERSLAILGVKDVLLLHGYPRQRPALLRHPLAQLGVFRLERGQIRAGRLPLLPRSGLVISHGDLLETRHVGL
jgi:hypothetical protein